MLTLSFSDKTLRYDVLEKAKVISQRLNLTLPDADNFLFKADNFKALSILLRSFAGKAVKSRKAYSYKMPLEKFLAFMWERLIIIHELLSQEGSLYLHIDCKTGHYVKILLDKIFGQENFKNDIARIKSNPKNFYRRAWGNQCDMILFYAKNHDRNIWNDVKDSLSEEEITKRFPKIDSQGRRYTTILLHAPGITYGITGQNWRDIPVPEVQDVWTFKDPQAPVYPTEKKHEMLRLIISQSSRENSIVLD